MASDAQLAEALAALGSQNRLSLLRQLQTPLIMTEIRLEPRKPGDPSGEGRSMARQAVRRHLRVLMQIGAVSALPTRREFGETIEYTVNQQRLFVLSEELRDLARLRPRERLPSAPTLKDVRLTVPLPESPRLLVVRGLEEGRAFPLAPGARGKEVWSIGRRAGSDIELPWDPFVSLDHASVEHEGTDYVIRDDSRSKNGTQVNFAPLAKGASQRLRHGDIVSVGRTNLAFQLGPPRE